MLENRREAQALESSSGDGDAPDDEPDALDHLDSFVDALGSQPTEASTSAANVSSVQKRILRSHKATGPENEFNSQGPTRQLQVDDLLAHLPEGSVAAAVQADLKQLAAAPSRRTEPLAVPLEFRERQRLDRKAAYALAKADVSSWDETSKQVRGGLAVPEGGARLSLSGDRGRPDVPDSRSWGSRFEASTSLEAVVTDLLTASSLASHPSAQGPQTTAPHLLARDARLAREAMDRSERKARWSAKIKSKSYRRLKRRGDRARDADLDEIQTLQELDAIDGGDRLVQRAGQLGALRAKERATLKHGGKGRWSAHEQLLSGLEDEEAASAQARLDADETLERKVRGDAHDRSQVASNSDASSDATPGPGDGALSRSVQNMKFMQPKKVVTVTDGDSQDSSQSHRRVFGPEDAAGSATIPQTVHGLANNPWQTDSRATTSQTGQDGRPNSNSRLKLGRKVTRPADDDDDSRIDISAELGSTFPGNKTSSFAGGRRADHFPQTGLQRGLAREAFADDGVVEAFAEEKAQVARDEGHSFEDTTLLGWVGLSPIHILGTRLSFRVLPGRVGRQRRPSTGETIRKANHRCGTKPTTGRRPWTCHHSREAEAARYQVSSEGYCFPLHNG